MAFNLQNGDAEELTEQHEINVTPFIDVILVLLIIFMVAAPLATVSVPVQLPASSSEQPATQDDPLYLTVQQDLTLTVGEQQQVSREQLGRVLQQQARGPEQIIFLRADRQLAYGDVMEIMSLLGQAGYSKVALVGLEKPEP